MTKWKVVALRNWVAESMVVEAEHAEIMEAGVLMLMTGDGNGRLNTVHAFAPGHWTEVSPVAEPAPKLDKRPGFTTFTIGKIQPVATTNKCDGCGSTDGAVRFHDGNASFCRECQFDPRRRQVGTMVACSIITEEQRDRLLATPQSSEDPK